MDGPDDQRGALCPTCAPITFNSSIGYSLKLGTLESLLNRQDCPVCRFSLKIIPERFLKEDPKLKVSISINPGAGTVIQKGRYTRDNYFKITDARPRSVRSPDLHFVEEHLKTCHNTHGLLCNPREGRLATLPSVLRFIDVRAGCIVQVRAPEWTPYVALSYVWGTQGNVKMTKANKQAFQEPGALLLAENNIPPLIRDAMQLTLRIGQWYLWVDALCIIQDDAADRHHQINHMDAIYERSYATIITIAAENVYSPIPGIGSRRDFPQYEVVKGKRLWYNKRPRLEAMIAESRWASRAWTFQEHLLSRRRIFVSENEILVECADCIVSEFGGSGLAASFGHHDLEYARLPMPMELNDAQTEGESAASRLAEDDLPGSPVLREILTHSDTVTKDFKLYTYHVEQYSARLLTNPDDILHAFTGLMSAWSRLRNWRFANGIPMQALRRALCWVPFTTYKPRPHAFHTRDWPTWSWAHVVGRIYFVPLLPSASESSFNTPEEAQSLIQPWWPAYNGLKIQSPAATFTIDSKTALFWVPAPTASSARPRLRMMVSDSLRRHCGIFWGLHPDLWDPPGEKDYKFIYLFSTYHNSVESLTTVHAGSYEEAVDLASKPMDWRGLPLPTDVHPWKSAYDRSEFESSPWSQPRATSNWWVVGLVVRRKGQYWERIGVGQVCRQAWNEALPAMGTFEII